MLDFPGIFGKPHLKVLDFPGFGCKGPLKMLDFPGIFGKPHHKVLDFVGFG